MRCKAKKSLAFYGTLLKEELRNVDSIEAKYIMKKEKVPDALKGYRLGLKIGLSYIEDIEEML